MNILILSPHTDDAELGAGGTISKLIKEGKHNIMWVVFSTAEESLPKNIPKNTLKNEFLKVLKRFNINNYKIFDYKVRYLYQHRQEILEQLILIRNEFKPNLVLTTSTFDFHQDHKVITEESIRAFKNLSSIIGYELPWNHLEIKNPLFVRLSKDDIEQKNIILSEYKSQIELNRNYFSKDFIYSLAKIRGVQCSTDFAESFEVIRWII